MTETTQKKQFNRAVLVGLHAHCLSDEENATEASLEELAALLETAPYVVIFASPGPGPENGPAGSRRSPGPWR